MSGLRTEGEVQQGMEEGRTVDCPLHDRFVRLSQGQERIQINDFPFRQNVVDVKELEGGPASLEEKDHKQGDEAEPEFGRPQFACAASADLHKESPPWDEQKNHRQYKGDLE